MSAVASKIDYCLWTFDDIEGFYKTECDGSFCFTDGGVEDNSFRFCPFCGLPIQDYTPPEAA